MFEPKKGMKTNDSYLHGIGEDMQYIGMSGRIECVGVDWFVLRASNGDVIFVREEAYCHIEEEDFS